MTETKTDYKVGYKKPPNPPWKPGETGNPAGRPKEPLTTLLREYLEEDNGERKHRIIKEIYKLAVATGKKGQFPALELIYNRLEGKPIEKHELMGKILVMTPEQLELANREIYQIQQDEQAFIAQHSVVEEGSH